MKGITLLSFLLCCCLGLLCNVAQSQAPEMTSADVEAFLNGVVPLQLDQEDIAGAVVVVVKNGSVLFARGYGYSDVKKKTPVSAETTLFRPGSVSKLLNWTAVMQMKEQGKVDLDHDVNEYLDFKIPPLDGKPVTLRNLMTHTAGFQETAKDLFVAKAPLLQPLKTYLMLHMPTRIFPPGTTPAYSNYGAGLAGYIVEHVSGKPFERYIEDSVIKPLGMEHSTFVQPLPAQLAPMMSQGYTIGSKDPGDFELVNVPPAGALSSTGTDMAKFIVAHLQEGRFGDFQLLKPETAREMHTRQEGWIDGVNAMCLGFYEESRNNHRIIGHGGDTLYFHSDLHLVLDAGVGFFVSYNSGGRRGTSVRTLLWEKFLDRYFPAPLPQDQVDSTLNPSPDIAGSYLVSRRAETGILRLAFPLLEMTVSQVKDGVMTVDQLKDSRELPKRWKQIRPMVFREVDGQELIGFTKDSAGNLTLQAPFPFFVFQRVSWNNDKRFLIPLVIFVAAMLLLTLIFWLVAALVRRHYGKTLALSPREKRLRTWTRLACLVQLVFLVAFTLVVVQGFNDVRVLSAGFDPWFRLLQGIALLGVIACVPAIANAFVALGSTERGRWAKLGEWLIALACIGFVWIVFAGRMLSLSLLY